MKQRFCTLTIAMLIFISFMMIGCFDSDKPVEVKPIVQAYWDGFHSIRSLFDDMKAKGYSYGNDWDDISYLTNYPKPLNQMMTDKYSNCLDYANWTSEFIKYKSPTEYVADSYETILMLSNRYVPRLWHYTNLISIYGELYEQSNTSLYRVNSEEEQWQLWQNKGYTYKESKGSWKR